MFANSVGVVVEFASTLKDFFKKADVDLNSIWGSGDLKHTIILEVCKEFTDDYSNNMMLTHFKDTLIEKSHKIEWKYDEFGDLVDTFITVFQEFGFDVLESVEDEIYTFLGEEAVSTGFSILKDSIGTGKLIDFLYSSVELGNASIFVMTFAKSFSYPGGIYIYVPTINSSYISNGITADTTTADPEAVFHAYRVFDTTFTDGNYEVYNIAMYKGGVIVQPNSAVTVRIPLSDAFKGVDTSKIKVYRHNDDGSLTNMHAIVVDDYVTFTTDHFSYYSIVKDSSTTYRLTVPNGTGTGDYAAGTQVSITANDAPDGKAFDKWTTSSGGTFGDASNSSTTFTMPANDVTVMATYRDSAPPAQNYSLTVTNGSGSYVTGEQVAITADATPTGKVFDKWTTNNGGTFADASSASTTFTMPASNVTITATYKDIVIPPTPGHTHSWLTAWGNNETHHWHECGASGCPITSNSAKNSYGAHVYDNDTDTTCNTCGYVREVTPPTPEHTHDWTAAWGHDATHHWHECLANGCTITSNSEKDGYGAHSYDDDTDTTCNDCGYVREVTPPTPEHTHSWTAAWSHDATHHWHECDASGCPITSNNAKSGYSAHVYDNDADTTCNDCGYVRTAMPPTSEHTHSWAAPWTSDAHGHWHDCTAGNCPITTNIQKDGYAAHTSDGGKVTTAATAYQNGVRTYSCTVCGYVIRTESIPATDEGPFSEDENGGGGGSGNDYAVSIPSRVTGGTVRVSPTRASKGTTVTITTTPNGGYELDRLTVTATGGSELALTDIGGGRFTFTMPGSGVTVAAAFTAAAASPAEPEIPVDPVRISFTDVQLDAYYYAAVVRAVEQGVTTGTTATTFSPDAPCTRAQMVTFLWRASGSPAPQSSRNSFTDIRPGYYYNAVLWAVEQGITNGTSAATFSPNAPVTRGQTVTFLHRAAGSPAADGGNPFMDVASNAYYADAVRWALSKGVTNGTGTETFSPDASCTRAQIVTFLYRGRAS